MIQRIQSLYLAMVIMLSLLFFTGNIFNFADASGKVFNLIMAGNLTDHEGTTLTHLDNLWPLIVLLILISSVSLITILLYKNRKVQLLLAVSVIVMVSCFAVALSWYAYSVTRIYSLTIIPGLKMTIPVFDLIFSILAWRGILKDDRLVRSYDRLR